MALNATLATAARSLEIFSAGMQVSGQNIANASTPGYIREELVLETADPYRRGSLIFGTGANAVGIQQQIDKYLETRLHSANTDVTAARARESVFQALELQLRELGEHDLSTSLNNFLAAVNGVANLPESSPARQIVVRQGEQLAQDVLALRDRINEVRLTQTARVDSLVAEANQLIDEIRELNPQIAQLESGGLLKSDAGALRTQRYNALSRLSEIIPIRFQEQSNGTVDVFSGSEFLILAGSYQHLEAVPGSDRGVEIQTVRLSRTKADISMAGGELRGVIEGRDVIVGGFVDQLDSWVGNLIFEFNRLHSSGEGLKGFTSVMADARITDPTAALNAAGLDFTPTHGSFQLRIVNQATGIAQTTTISVDLDGIGADTSLDDLRAAIDAAANVSATIDSQGRLQLTADAGYEIRFANDTSGTLAALGVNTFFTGHDSSTIGVNEIVAKDHAYFA